MSEQHPANAAPQYSQDGRWWWTGTHWVPVPAKTRRSGRGIALVLVLVSVAVIGFLLLVGLVSRPIGTQVEMDGELDESYCQMFPEDCS